MDNIVNNDKTYVGEVGKQILLNAWADLSDATNVYINIIKPDGTSAVWTGTILTIDSRTQYVEYFTQEYVNGDIITYDLDQSGKWELQLEIDTIVSDVLTKRVYGETAILIVYDLGS